MEPAEIARRRLAAQGVAGPAEPSVAGAAHRLLATQAQDLHGAEWALALRSTGLRSDVDEALASGTVVRTWPMRGTLLIVARHDARWLTELAAPRSFAASASIWRRAGLVEGDFVTAASVARDVLAGGRALPRAALLRAFDEAGLETSGGRGSHLIRRIAGEAVIVLGPARGTEQTLVLFDEWLPDAERLDRDEALARLADRYLSGHGPATAHDLAWWSGLTVTEAKRAVALAGDAVERLDDGLLVSARAAGAGALGADRAGGPDVRLLPPFDELLLGYRDRSASLAAADFARVVPHSNGLFSAVLTVDGVVVGVWRRSLVGSATSADASVEVEVEPFAPLPGAVASAVERRAAEYARHLGRRLILRL